MTSAQDTKASRTVRVRIQVVDVAPQLLDVDVANYLPSKDLSQRVAKDAGLMAYWPDGRRRHYWLRARGRILHPDERLVDMGVINNELLHLLPEPESGGAVQERPLGIEAAAPPRGRLQVWGLRLVMSGVWSMCWILVMRESMDPVVAALGSAVLAAFWSTWMNAGGEEERSFVTAIVRGAWGWLPWALVACVMVEQSVEACALLLEDTGNWNSPKMRPCIDASRVGLVILASGGLGLVWGWLASLPILPRLSRGIERVAVAAYQSVAEAPCGVCETSVGGLEQVSCPYNCARVFHSGCLKTSMSMSRDDTRCPMCEVAL